MAPLIISGLISFILIFKKVFLFSSGILNSSLSFKYKVNKSLKLEKPFKKLFFNLLFKSLKQGIKQFSQYLHKGQVKFEYKNYHNN